MALECRIAPYGILIDQYGPLDPQVDRLIKDEFLFPRELPASNDFITPDSWTTFNPDSTQVLWTPDSPNSGTVHIIDRSMFDDGRRIQAQKLESGAFILREAGSIKLPEEENPFVLFASLGLNEALLYMIITDTHGVREEAVPLPHGKTRELELV